MGRVHRGIVLDISATGVFVQSEAGLAPGDRVRLRFRPPESGEFEVDARVARRQVAPAQLATVVRGGLGLRVHAPPPAYFELIGEGADEAARSAASSRSSVGRAPARAAGPPAPARPFRVRVKQSAGSRSRTLRIEAASEDEARRRALADVGAGWEILGVEAG